MKNNRFAIIKDESGQLARLSGNNIVEIYEGNQSDWQVTGTINFNIGDVRGIELMRTRLRELCRWLTGVKAIIAISFEGISFQVLKQAGFSLCEMTGFEPECLGELETALDETEDDGVPVTPIEEGDTGRYFFDLAAALSTTELSSKKILRPFFDQTKFIELLLICDHVPPWLPPELKQRGFNYESLNYDHKIQLKIFPDCSNKASQQ